MTVAAIFAVDFDQLLQVKALQEERLVPAWEDVILHSETDTAGSHNFAGRVHVVAALALQVMDVVGLDKDVAVSLEDPCNNASDLFEVTPQRSE